MSNVIDMKPRIDRLWQAADEAHQRGLDAYIDFSRACAELADKEQVTQTEIGARYNMSQQAIGHAMQVGRDKRINSIAINQLPRAEYTIYLLTTLNDKGFAMLAKPDTTRDAVLAYKETHTPADKAKGKGRPRKGRKFSADTVLIDEGLLDPHPVHGLSGGQRKAIRSAITEIDPDITLFDEARAADLARVCRVVRERRRADGKPVYEPESGVARDELPRSAQEKLDSALRRYQRELDAQHARRLLELEKLICDEVDRRLPDHARQEIERAHRQVKQAEFLQRGWRAQMEISQAAVQLFYDTWRTLAQCLHPDRAPEDRHAQFRDASVRLNLLKAAFDKIDRQT